MLSGVFEKSMLPDVQEKHGKIKNNFNLKLLSEFSKKDLSNSEKRIEVHSKFYRSLLWIIFS